MCEIVETPGFIVNELELMKLTTLKKNPCVPSGKIVVVIPEPPGQVKLRFCNLTISPVVTPCPTEVTVESPVTLSYTNPVIFVTDPEGILPHG